MNSSEGMNGSLDREEWSKEKGLVEEIKTEKGCKQGSIYRGELSSETLKLPSHFFCQIQSKILA